MERTAWHLPFGAEVGPGGVEFRVWAPAAQTVAVEIQAVSGPAYYPLRQQEDGFFAGLVPGIGAGTLYKYRLDGAASYPDPASRFQPEGVHGPSQVVDPRSYLWHDAGWRGLQAQGLVIYECHVGTYTPEGTFDALAAELPELKRLGVTAVQIMPVAEFPGTRNWGYDGVDLYAPTRNYGGPEGLKRLVDAAHAIGLGVILDVVYNHLGPDGNYLRAFSPYYFTDRYTTPWGEAINYDGEQSRWVREFIVQNACYWLNEYHLDGLRLDATHAIHDQSETHIVREISERVHASLPPERRVVLIAEDGTNNVRFLHPPEQDGYGMDVVYADDFHHEVRVLLTGEKEGYYVDYTGRAADIATALKQGFYYQGQPSLYAGRSRGTRVTDEPARQFLFFIQNHDQVGNRAFGDRLNHAVEPALYAAASSLQLLSPETPLLFMGQEFAASAPFLFFTDHNEELGRLVTAGRREEFKRFSAFSDPEQRERIPDPQTLETFRRSKLDLTERQKHAGVYRLYADLLALRHSDPVFRAQDRFNMHTAALAPRVVAMHGWQKQEHRLVVVNFGDTQTFRFDGERFLSDLPPEARYVMWTSASPRYGLPAAEPATGTWLSDELVVPAKTALVLGSSGDV